MKKSAVILFLISIFSNYYSSAQIISANDSSVIIKSDSSEIHIQQYANSIFRIDLLPINTQPLRSLSVILSPGIKNHPEAKMEKGVEVISFKNYSVKIIQHPFSIQLLRNDSLLSELTDFSLKNNLTSVSFALSPNENLYGTGSRALPYNLRGQKFDSYNQAHYGYQFPYKNLNLNIPFVLSSHQYGIFFDGIAAAHWDLGDTDKSKMTYSIEQSSLTFYWIGGNNLKTLTENFCDLTGHQSLPPRWALGFMQSKFGYKSDTEAYKLVQDFAKDHFPLDAIFLDVYWFGKPQVIGNLSWDTSHFHHPDEMINDFNKIDVHTILITEPYVTQISSNWRNAAELNLFAKNKNGNSFITDKFWAGPASLIDDFNPQSRSWMWSKLKSFSEKNSSGWWTDLGEPELHPNEMIHINGNEQQVHNGYALEWNAFMNDSFENDFPNVRFFHLVRSGFAGMQRYNVFPWSGDVSRSWQGLQAQIPIMLQNGLCGVGYMHSDLGGYTGKQNNKLYARWLEFGCFVPVMRAHGNNDAPVEPYNYPDSILKIVRGYIDLRYELLPYNYSMAHQNTESGNPLVRPLNFNSFDDTTANKISDEYFWGNDFLIAPMIDSTLSRKVYLPKSDWINFWNDSLFTEGKNYLVPAPLNQFPVFVRKGSIIPMTKLVMNTSQYHSDSLELNYYPDANSVSNFSLYDDDGKTRNGNSATIYLSALYSEKEIKMVMNQNGNYPGCVSQRDVVWIIHSIKKTPKKVLVEGKFAELNSMNSENKNPGWFYDKKSNKLYIHFTYKNDNEKISVKF
jgi:oligosaccharide 4-alpha-D-glucosyltransferase